MNNYLISPGTITGTATGTLLVIFMQVETGQLLNTIILAAVGALVSFLVSLACKFLWEQVNDHKNNF